jgi:hypothetical protein
MRIDHEILLPDGTIAASGATVVVAWDREQRGARPISAAERAALSPRQPVRQTDCCSISRRAALEL